MKTIEQRNIETVTAFIEAFWNRNDMDSTEQFLSDDYQEHSYESKEGLVKFARQILESFPDKQYTVEEIIAQGEKVIARLVVRGTHTGMFFGHSPTGKSIEVTLFREYRVVDGKIAEHRGWIDLATLMRQIGAK